MKKTSKINHKNTDVISALADDLNTPELIVKLNKIIKEYNSSNKDKQKTKDQLDLISEALGILKDDSYKKVSPEIEEKINTLIAERAKAKINRNYDLADKIRDDLLNAGIIIKDTGQETTWEVSQNLEIKKLKELCVYNCLYRATKKVRFKDSLFFLEN